MSPTFWQGFEPRSGHVGFVVDWGRLSPSTSDSPAGHSTDRSTFIIIHHQVLLRPSSGRHTKWTQSHPDPGKCSGV
jgi:hypothetical protein